MSTILNALNKVQAEQQENLRRDMVVRGKALEQRTRKLRESETRREVEDLLNKLREDFRAQLYFLRNENRLLRQALEQAPECQAAMQHVQVQTLSPDATFTRGEQSQQLGLRFIENISGEIRPKGNGPLSREQCEHWCCMPLRPTPYGWLVAMPDPSVREICDAIEDALGTEIIPVVAERIAILDAVARG